jgi:hypothetical protein
MTQPLPPESAIATLATQQAAAQAAVNEQLLVMLEALWLALGDPSSTERVEQFTVQAAALLRSAQLATGSLMETYLRQVLEQLGVDDLPAGALVNLAADLRGVPLEEVLARPLATVRWRRSQGDPLDVASATGLQRLRTTAETDLELAVRQGAVDIFSKTKRVQRYRRILRPYLSAGGSCGLCVAASDRLYKRGDLMPIHGRCKCSVLPVVGNVDPGLELNGYDLNEIYRDAGGNTAAKLKRTRYRVEQHGELGPVLVLKGHDFRTADQAEEAAA